MRLRKKHLDLDNFDPIEDSGEVMEKATIGPGLVVAVGIGAVVAVAILTAIVRWVR